MPMLPLTNGDKRLKCLCGLPFDFYGINIFPITVKEIINIGESKYYFYLMTLTHFKETISAIIEDGIDIEKIEKMDDFDIIIVFSAISPFLVEHIIESLEFFIKNDYIVSFNSNKQGFDIINQEKEIIEFIDKEKFDEFLSIIKFQNYMLKDEKTFKSKKARELMKQKEESQKKLQKLKGKGEAITLADYISIVNAKTFNLIVNDVLNMTIYSLFDLLHRIMLIDNYEIGIQQLLAGAEASKVELKHWFTNM